MKHTRNVSVLSLITAYEFTMISRRISIKIYFTQLYSIVLCEHTIILSFSFCGAVEVYSTGDHIHLELSSLYTIYLNVS